MLPEDAISSCICVSVIMYMGRYSCVLSFRRSYGYLTYETAEQAKEAAEKYKDAEMDGTKLLVVHYGTYIDPVAPSSKG